MLTLISRQINAHNRLDVTSTLADTAQTTFYVFTKIYFLLTSSE